MSRIERTQFFNRLMKGIYGPRQGGARIIIDAQNAATGVGKTSLAVALARTLADRFGYDLTDADGVLSGSEYLRRWQQHPGKEQPSVIILDELSGGGAADTRRAMSESNVELGRAWETMRTKRIVTITTLPHWSYGDTKLQQLADFRLWCLEEPIGNFVPYKVGAAFDDGDTRLSKLDNGPLDFPDMASLSDPVYDQLAEKKDELLAAKSMDADDALSEDAGEEDPEEAVRQQRIETAQRAREQGLTCDEAADLVGMSKSWVSRHTTGG